VTRATVTRFAPSPTGYLHLGHAFAALEAYRAADMAGNGAGGRFLLRLEDIDRARCRAAFERAIYEDLAWLGLAWEQPVRRQSDCFADYAGALAKLEGQGLLYRCFCSRAEIRAEIARADAAPHGPEGPVYPGICRGLSAAERDERGARGDAFALRLDMAAATRRAGALHWHDRAKGEVTARPARFGDVVLARKETPTSYHLAATLDDHLQGVSLVTRAEDLFEATHVHRLLQALLGLETPQYAHHRVLTDGAGRRFAKRDRALTLRALREAGIAALAVREALESGSDDPAQVLLGAQHRTDADQGA
jgi:glutamyl-Q tRNA(Asp) synthetase